MRRRVYVTGIGAVSPLGNTVDDTWSGLLAGRSGIRVLSGIDLTDLDVRIGGEIRDFDPTAAMRPAEVRRQDPHAWFGVAAAAEAMDMSGLAQQDRLVEPHRFGVLTATGYGPGKLVQAATMTVHDRGVRTTSPHLSVYGSPDAISATLTSVYDAMGPSYAVSAACATGTIALGLALRTIRHGYADALLVVGAEDSLTRQDIASTANAGALTKLFNDAPERASRPFDRSRSGFVMSAGAAALVLESEDLVARRGGSPLAELQGYGESSDAYHPTAPHPQGVGARLAMVEALSDAGAEPGSIDYVNAHGTSTKLNDAIELRAITEVFGDRARAVPISSTKSMTGHLLGAAGALEAVVSVLTLRDGFVPPTINLEDPEFEGYDLVPNVARRVGVERVMSNSFGFGGHNAAIVCGRAA